MTPEIVEHELRGTIAYLTQQLMSTQEQAKVATEAFLGQLSDNEKLADEVARKTAAGVTLAEEIARQKIEIYKLHREIELMKNSHFR